MSKKQIVKEILNLREVNKKVYLMSDGSYKAVYYPRAVHVLNEETGNFEDIVNALSEEEILPDTSGESGIGLKVTASTGGVNCANIEISFPEDIYITGIKKACLNIPDLTIDGLDSGEMVYIYENEKSQLADYFVYGTQASLDITRLIDDYLNGRREGNIHLELRTDNAIFSQGDIVPFNPTLTVDYENNFAVNTSGSAHIHSLGRFGTGFIDLVNGYLMLESEDFAWGGNRMPITIKHLYNSALAHIQYTNGNTADLNTADFSGMVIGNGFKLNLMQSMVAAEDKYIHTDDYGNRTVFALGEEGKFESEQNGAAYDAENKILDFGDEKHCFDASGRLIKITDSNENALEIVYENGKLVKAVDGVGREFIFAYNENQLSSITAPDNSAITYNYENNFLTGIAYPDGRKVSIAYDNNSVPSKISLHDAEENLIYGVNYTATANKKIIGIEEFGQSNIAGQSAQYEYYTAAGYTKITAHNKKFVFTYDEGGNPSGEYKLDDEGEKAEITVQSAAGIDPYIECSGVETDNYNELVDAALYSSEGWKYTNVEKITDENEAKFGTSALKIYDDGTAMLDLEVVTDTDYTFSTYVKVKKEFTGGVYLAVTDTSGNIIARSEKLRSVDGVYERLSVTFKSTVSKVNVCIIAEGTGEAVISNSQLEKNSFATEYNSTNILTSTFEISASLSSSSMNWSFGTDVKKAASTRETYLLTAWAKAPKALPNSERGKESVFRMRAILKYADNETEEFIADLNPNNHEWQRVNLTIEKTRFAEVSGLTIWSEYNYNLGKAYFYDVQLDRQYVETNLTAADFESGDVSGETEVEAQEYNTETGEDFTEITDEYGNPLTETLFNKGKYGALYRSFGYNTAIDENGYNAAKSGNDLTYETDNRGKMTTYRVDTVHSRNDSVINRAGTYTCYDYDNAGRISKIENKTLHGDKLANVCYGYDSLDNLESITRGDGMAYELKYTAFNKPLSIGVAGELPLVQYSYEDNNGRVKEVSYANGDACEFIYNEYGQLTEQKWHNDETGYETTVNYSYDKEGNVISLIDSASNRRYNYVYDEGALISAVEQNGEEFTVVKYVYSEDGALLKKKVTLPDGNEQIYSIESGEDGNSIITLDNLSFVSGSDELGRKAFDEIQTGVANISRSFEYHKGCASEIHKQKGAVKSVPTTKLVSRLTFADGRTLRYEYDNEERITKVIDSFLGEWEYTYDELGQLLTENYKEKDRLCSNRINRMTYDNYGNIKSKNGVYYVYDKNWKDKLIYRGVHSWYKGEYPSRTGRIEYDNQGNPISYFGNELVWEKGRQLKSFNSIEYTYNANGIRTEKTYCGITHKYCLEGAKILSEAWQNNTLIPLYDNEENICGIDFNGEKYFFEKNLQGDIISIKDINAKQIARYSYDAWGKCKILEDNSDCRIAEVNPFRYRSYYFDTETNLYYLQSRYYDPEVARFINGDEVENLDCIGNLLPYNLYTYCEQDPINNTDETGKAIWSTIAKALLGVLNRYVSDIIENIFKQKKGWKVFKPFSSVWKYTAEALSAIIKGGKLFKSLASAVISGVCRAIEKALAKKKEPLWRRVANFFLDAFTGIIGTFIAELIFSKVMSFTPSNYSKFAKSQYMKNAKITPNQIRTKMQKLIRTGVKTANVFGFLTDALLGAVSI